MPLATPLNTFITHERLKPEFLTSGRIIGLDDQVCEGRVCRLATGDNKGVKCVPEDSGGGAALTQQNKTLHLN